MPLDNAWQPSRARSGGRRDACYGGPGDSFMRRLGGSRRRKRVAGVRTPDPAAPRPIWQLEEAKGAVPALGTGLTQDFSSASAARWVGDGWRDADATPVATLDAVVEKAE